MNRWTELLLEATLPPLGYELVDCGDVARGPARPRVHRQARTGVDVEDCARVSNHLTRLFAVENVDFDRLEVSSPGLDRPLRKPADFARFAGEEARAAAARRRWTDARRMQGHPARRRRTATSCVETAKGDATIPLADIDRARLVPKIEWRKAT